jgi:beta-glucanase (GH16 family)
LGVVQAGTGVVRDYVPDGIHPSDQMYVDGGIYIANQWRTATGGGVVTPPPQDADPMPAVPAGHPNTYVLTFNEEFNGSSLNFNVWTDYIWYGESTEKTGKPVNWQVGGGELKIWPVGPGFADRSITTDFKYYQTFGFFEIEAKLPYGQGTWPAFWLFNHDGVLGDSTMRPEIDIMEAYAGGTNTSPNPGWATSDKKPNNFGISYHRKPGSTIGTTKLRNYEPWKTNAPILSDGYHKYGLLWETDGCTVFFDGAQVGPKVMTDFFQFRMFIILDLWYGSASGEPDSTTPQGIGNSFAIRYCRAWRKN